MRNQFKMIQDQICLLAGGDPKRTKLEMFQVEKQHEERKSPHSEWR